jgi:hypothetical protein
MNLKKRKCNTTCGADCYLIEMIFSWYSSRRASNRYLSLSPARTTLYTEKMVGVDAMKKSPIAEREKSLASLLFDSNLFFFFLILFCGCVYLTCVHTIIVLPPPYFFFDFVNGAIYNPIRYSSSPLSIPPPFTTKWWMMKGFPSYHPEGSRSFVRSFAHSLTKQKRTTIKMKKKKEGRNGLEYLIVHI